MSPTLCRSTAARALSSWRAGSPENEGSYDASTGHVTITELYTTYIYNAFDAKGTGVSEHKNVEPVDVVSPLTPLVVIPDKEDIPLVATVLGENQLSNGGYIVPAILLKYSSDKIRNDYIEKGIYTMLDLSTIVFSGGTMLAADVQLARRIWAFAEVVGSMGDIAVNTQTVDPNSNLAVAINAYNLTMGAVGVKNLVKGTANFTKNMSGKVKAAIENPAELRTLLREPYTKFKETIAKVRGAGTEVPQELREREAVLDRIMDEAGSVAKGADAISVALKAKIFNTLSKIQADELIKELGTNSTLKAALESNEVSVAAWKRIADGISEFRGKNGYVETLKKMTKYQAEAGGSGTVKYYRVQGGQGASAGQTSKELLTIESKGNIKFNSTSSDLNISTNDRLHADYFLANKRPSGEIIEFEVPKWLDDQIKASAVPQYKAPSNLSNVASDAPKIVDPTQPGNPFELPSKWHQLIEQNYIKGSAKIVK